jgi:hypothetical protein
MAIEYVDSDFTGTSDGSINNPWKTGNDATLANDLTLLWKRGTTDVLSAALTTTHTDITFGSYGSGDLPIVNHYEVSTNTGDWTDTGGNIWTYTAGAGFDSLFLLALGSLPANPRDHLQWNQRVNYRGGGSGTKTTFDTFGEWDSDSANPSVLYLYSDENPVTKWGSIFFVGQNTNSCIYVGANAANVIIENINFRFAASGVRFQGTTGNLADNVTFKNSVIEFCYEGVRLSGFAQDVNMSGNEFYACARTGIQVGGTATENTKKNTIDSNRFYDTGYGEGIGHIYGRYAPSSASTGLKVYRNKCYRSHKGIYWSGEGFGIYPESQAANWDVIANVVADQRSAIGSQAAFHSNGGTGHRWIGNLCYNTSVGFNGSDALPTDNMQEEIFNNTFSEVDLAFTFTRPSLSGGEVFNITIYNNICTSSTGGPPSVGISLDPDVDDLGGIDNDYNFLYGFVTNIRRTSGTLLTSLGTNTNTTDDPDLDANYAPSRSSPCIGAGIKVWTGPNPEGGNGEPFSDFDTDAGYIQTTYNPFHPVNL